jgi:hypothetical protein
LCLCIPTTCSVDDYEAACSGVMNEKTGVYRVKKDLRMGWSSFLWNMDKHSKDLTLELRVNSSLW